MIFNGYEFQLFMPNLMLSFRESIIQWSKSGLRFCINRGNPISPEPEQICSLAQVDRLIRKINFWKSRKTFDSSINFIVNQDFIMAEHKRKPVL